jgi:hypothetical protein
LRTTTRGCLTACNDSQAFAAVLSADHTAVNRTTQVTTVTAITALLLSSALISEALLYTAIH